MESVFKYLVQLDEIFVALERKSRPLENPSNGDQGLIEIPWEILKNLNSCLPLNGNLRYCEEAVRENVINLFERLLTRLLKAIQHDTFDLTWKIEVYQGIFTRSCHAEALSALCRALETTSPSVKQDVILSILKTFVVGHSFSEMMFDQCYLATTDSSSISKKVPNPMWTRLISFLVSLPDRVANKLSGIIGSPFDKTSYGILCSDAIIITLTQVCEELSHNRNASLEFMSQFLGRLCLTGYADLIFEKITPKILNECKNNFIWRKASSRLFVGVQDRCLENVLRPLLNNIPWYGYVKYFIGERLVKQTLRFLISQKFILIRQSENTRILRNCIGYLAEDEIQEEHKLFLELISHVLQSWSDATSLRYLSYEQNFAWTAALAMCAGYLKNIDFKLYKQVYLTWVTRGVQMHISSSSEPIRVQGMVIGQLYVSILEPDGPKLEFEYEETDEVKTLLAFTKIPEEPKEMEPQESSPSKNIPNIQSPADIGISANTSETGIANNISKQVIDSDDDLEPYELTDDTDLPSTMTPLYVRDCLQGLIDHANPEWTQSCLERAEHLIKSQPTAAEEVSEEMAKVLLHLDNNFSCDQFVSWRFKALVAILVNSPEDVVKYMTAQFYDRNYSIRQRLDMLEVMAAASQELSGIQNVSAKPIERNTQLGRVEVTESQLSSWKEVLRKRIENKTRIISKGCCVEPPVEIENQFSKVAGCFFFPLLTNYDSKQNSFDLLGDDSYLLARLIYTLGIFINSASNSLVVKKLAKHLLEFLWIFRYHVEVFVRQSLLFALSMILLNVPGGLLVLEFQSELVEYQSWLQDVVSKDTDTDCRKIATQVSALMGKTIQEEVSFNLEDSQNK